MKRTKRLLLCCFGILLVAGWQTVVADDSETWMSGVPNVHSYAIDNTQNKVCRQVNDIKAMNLSYPDGVTVDGCLYEGLYLDLLRTNALQGSRLYVKFSNEQYFRGLDVDMISHIVPGTDVLVTKTLRGIEPTQVAIYRSLSGALRPLTYNSENVVTSYGLDTSQAVRILPEPSASTQNHLVYNEAFSANGKYIIAYVDREGYVKIDLETMTATIIAHARTDWSSGPPPVAAAISRDGRYALIDSGAKIVDTSGCGDAFGNGFVRNTMERPCSTHELTNYIQRSAGYFARGENYAFTDQDRSIEFDMYEAGIHEPHHVRIDKPGYIRDTTRLEYLALGDSYSSGEGDIGVNSEGMKFYLPLTDTDKNNNCHISSRSYPFLLRDAWGIYPEQMKSVACSGAQVLLDYHRPTEGYLGQNGRLSNDKDIASKQRVALERFLPGRIPQLEFVKKYQPSIVTLTGGGNDVGFVDVLIYCASPHWDDLVAIVDSTCSYAIEGSDTRKLLFSSIRSQARVNKSMITKIKESSPDTEIIIVGYPSFISNSVSVCQLNGGILGMPERRMLNEMVEFMNEMLQRTAYETGVVYVDVEHSLDGGRICEGSEYMTGVWSNINGKADDQERFHPNADGHKKIAKTIEVAPIEQGSLPGNFDTSEPYVTTQKAELVEEGVITKDEAAQLDVKSGILAPNSPFELNAHSTPKYLGRFESSNDGSVNLRLDTSSISIGRHTLILEGISRSGEQIKLYQFIEMHYSSKDADGDGIENEIDRCNFIVAWLDEQNSKDICVTHQDNLEPPHEDKEKLVEDSDSSKSPVLSIGLQRGEVSKTALLSTGSQSYMKGTLGNQLISKSTDKSVRSEDRFSGGHMVIIALSVIIGTIVIWRLLGEKIKK